MFYAISKNKFFSYLFYRNVGGSDEERLNISLRSQNSIESLLSNLKRTPFKIGDITFRSVESALQGIKMSDPDERMTVFKMKGIDALKYVRAQFEEHDPEYVYWDGEEILYNSKKHRLLLSAFIREKIWQNEDVQSALLATTGYHLYHDVGPESPTTSLPEKFFIQVLLSERKVLEKLEEVS